MTTKEKRQAKKLSQVQCAVRAGVSIGTWRMFEVSPDSVSTPNRAKCESVLGDPATERAA